MTQKNPLNYWDLVSPSSTMKSGDYGFGAVSEQIRKYVGVQFDDQMWSILVGKIYGGLFVYVLAYFLYYMIINMNRSSEMMLYIAFAVYLWTVMLGVIMFLFVRL